MLEMFFFQFLLFSNNLVAFFCLCQRQQQHSMIDTYCGFFHFLISCLLSSKSLTIIPLSCDLKRDIQCHKMSGYYIYIMCVCVCVWAMSHTFEFETNSPMSNDFGEFYEIPWATNSVSIYVSWKHSNLFQKGKFMNNF